jgi:hypothetical protein
MKKIIFLIYLLAVGFSSMAQNDEVDELTLLDSMMIYKNATKATIIEVLTDGTVRLKNIADPINDADGVNKLWVLNQGGVTAVDSSSLNPANAELYLWKGGVAVDTTDLDIGYFAVGDLADYVPLSGATTIYVTPTQMNDAIAAAAPAATFTITLPSAGSVNDRITGATEVPSGWTLTPDGLNINIEHNLGRYCNAVTVFATTTSPANQQLTNTAAYNGLTNVDTNNTKILSLATILKEIRIFISFTQ